MKKFLLSLGLILGGLVGLNLPLSAQQNYNFNIGGLGWTSGASVPGSCPADGYWYWLNTGSKAWYVCANGTYSPVGNTGSSGTVTSVSAAASGGLQVTGTPTVNPSIGLINCATGNVLASTGVNTWGCSAAGSGTVSTFSAGTLSPLFTTSVATASSTPALTFTLSNAGADTVLGSVAGGAPTYFTPSLASALFANQGTTTTVLHGNAAGNPSFGAVVNGDIAAATIDLTTKVTGLLPIANGGNGSASPGIVAGTNITVSGSWPTQTVNSTAGGGTVSTTGSPVLNQVTEFNSALVIKGSTNFTDSGISLNYGGQINPGFFGNGPNNECEVDGIVHTTTQSCGDAAVALSLKSQLIRSNAAEDITTDPFGVNLSPEWYLGTGLNATICDTTHINCIVLEVPLILGTGATIRGTGNVPVAVTNNMSQGTIFVTGNNWPAPLGVPTESAPTCSASGTGTLVNGTYFVYVRTANNLETHSGKTAVAGPSMHTTEFSVTCSGGTSTQTINVPIPSAVGNSPFQAQDFQVAASTVSGLEQLQANDTTNMSCTAGVVSIFNSVNYGCKMSGGTAATIKTIQTATRFFEDTDLSNVAVVEVPNQTVGFGTSISGVRLNCGPIGSVVSFNAPNWMVWNQAGEELNGLSPFGLGIVGPCGGYSAGSPATGGSATAFGGGWVYQDTHSPNSTLEHVSLSGGPNCGSTCTSTTTFTPILLDGRADGTGIAAGTPRRISDITVNAKGSGAYVSPAMIYATGLRTFVLADTLHSEATLIGQGDGNNGEFFQVDNGARAILNRVESQVATTGVVAHLTSTGGGLSVEGLCPIGTAGSTQDRCAGLGQTGAGATIKDDTNGKTYTGFIAHFESNGLTSVFGNIIGTNIIDFSNASVFRPKFGTVASLPGTCTVGDVYEATNATAGQNWYFCTATNIFTQQLNSGGSGFANPMTTLGDLIYGGASGTATRLAGPTGVNGVAQSLVSIPSGGAAVAPIWAPSGIPTNAQTGTTYTLVATDRANYVTFSNAGAIAVTLPQAGTTGFASNFTFVTCNIGTGTATITPTTSTISFSTGSAYTAGASSLALTTGQCAFIYSDNTNYFALQRTGGSGSGTVTSVAETVPSGFAVSGSPVTTSGTLGITYSVSGAGQIINSSGSNTAGFTATPTISGLTTFSGAGAASTPGVTVSGAPFTGGSGTTTFPQFFLNAGAAVTTFATTGTEIGVNSPSGFTGNFLDFHVNGGASVAKLDSTGAYTGLSYTATGATAGAIQLGQGTDNANGTTAVVLQAGTAVTSYRLTLPLAAPTNNNSAMIFSNATPGVGTFAKIQQTAITSGTAYTNATTTFSNVVGGSGQTLQFSVEANTNYTAACEILWQGSAATTGPKFQFTGPASPTAVAASLFTAVTATTFIAAPATAFSSSMADTGTITTATNFNAHITLGLVNGANAGTVTLQAAANGTGTLTIQPGSFCQLQ